MGINLGTQLFNKAIGIPSNATQRILTSSPRTPRVRHTHRSKSEECAINQRYYNVFHHSSSLARSRPVPTGRTYIKVMKRSLQVAALVALCGESVQALHVSLLLPAIRFDSLSGTAKWRLRKCSLHCQTPSRIYQSIELM